MTNFKNPAAPSLLVAAFFCLVLFVLGAFCRPLFPVDETRYLTVAWEMFTSGDWVLPHLNHEAYDHKPPLLFWTINILWKIFGVSQEAAMAVPFFFAFAYLGLTQRFARRIRPDDKNFPLLATLILAGSMPFIVYSSMIMFDLMLGVCSLLALTAVWDYARDGKAKHLLTFALAVGLGALAKGPVILLHVLFPVVFARFWVQENPHTPPRKNWIAGFTAAVLGGAIIGLCWAIPAAIKGGPEFAHKIFIGQTAGRVTNAFDHRHPFWWYLPYLPVLLMPWIFSPLFWRGVTHLKTFDNKSILRFLAIWIVPVFISFCAVSGKQVHYLLPLIPGVALFVALAFREAATTYRPRDAIIPFLTIGILILTPFILKMASLEFSRLLDNPMVASALGPANPVIPVGLFALAAILVFVFSKRGMLYHVAAISLSALLLMVCFQVESKDGYFKNYDLTPIAEVIMKNPGAPLAFTRNYHGEWGFMARLDRPVKEVQIGDLPKWFRENPHGMAFIRTGHPEELKPYDIIFTMSYKMSNAYAIAVKRGQAAHFAK